MERFLGRKHLGGRTSPAVPSLTLGADYYALSDQPAMVVNLSPLPIVAQQPFVNRDSAGFQGVVTQPLYTSGRISYGIAAAQSASAPIRPICAARCST